MGGGVEALAQWTFIDKGTWLMSTSEALRVGRQTCNEHCRVVHTYEPVDKLGNLRSLVVELGCEKGKVLMKSVDWIDMRVKQRKQAEGNIRDEGS
jgi:hypothetical protein